MKTIFKSAIMILAALSLVAFSVDKNKPSKTITITFWVAGICGMCESTIEKAIDVKGVVAADYVLATNMLTVTYKPRKITEERLHALLNEAGYDTEKSKANDEQYNRVHNCCKYREQGKH